MALCLSIFGRDDSLIYLRIKESEKPCEHDLQMFLYCSFDVIGEKSKLALSKSAQEPYLGSLLLNNTYRSYGYLTNTNVKFLLVTDVANTLLKDQDIRAIFKKLHSDYCKAISNPFYTISSPLNSRFLSEATTEIFES